MKKKIYPILSLFVNAVNPINDQDELPRESLIADATLDIFSFSKISDKTKELSFDFANELINYFTPDLLLHHHQDEVPVFTIYLGVDEYSADINTYGGYYTIFIENLPALRDKFQELLILIKNDLDINENNIKDIILELEDTPRVDVRNNFEDYDEDDYQDDNELNWSYARIVRTPYSEVYTLYLNNHIAGEVHIHIGSSIHTTIITTLDISEREKAELMGDVHEMLLETLEQEYRTKSTMLLYSEAVDDI
ncbi:MAG: hypothetical protein Q8936_04950 [Bacillota bacterium]|nr:hypothetical protein [Bacillota bacterium]